MVNETHDNPKTEMDQERQSVVPQESLPQKPPKKRKRRTGLKIFIVLVLLLVVLLFFLSDIAKWYIENNGKSLVNRNISISELHINYLKFSVSVKGFTLYEQNEKDSFVSFDELRIDFDPWQLLSNRYAFSEIKLVKPNISVIYDEKGFNFDDIIAFFDTSDEPDSSDEVVKYLVKNLNITEGFIRYEDKTIASVTELKNLGITIPEIAWDNSRSELGIDFEMGENGKVSLSGAFDQEKGLYELHAKTEQLDASLLKEYLTDIVDVGSMGGALYTDLSITGSIDNLMNIIVKGEAGVQNLLLTGPDMKPFATVQDIHVIIDSLNLLRENYCINSIEINSPIISAVLAKDGANYDKVLAPFYADTLPDPDDTIEMHYNIDKLSITNGTVSYHDYTLNRPFIMDISDIEFRMDNYTDLATKVPLDFKMLINETGKISGNGTVNMLTLDGLDMVLSVKNMDMVFLSPYAEYFLARPITKGVMNYDCSVYMTPVALENNNHIKIVDLDMGKKTKDTTAYKVPIGLALYILKDRNDVIEFDLPVTGNPSEPSFKLRKIIWKTLEEFMIKTAAAPFNAIGNAFGGNPEKFKQIEFSMLQDSLSEEQSANLSKIATMMKKKDKLAFEFIQTTDPDLEKQLLAVRECKTQ